MAFSIVSAATAGGEAIEEKREALSKNLKT